MNVKARAAEAMKNWGGMPR